MNIPQVECRVSLPLDDSVRREFESKGFARVRRALDSETVNTISDDLMKLLGQAPNRFRGREINLTSDGLVNSLHNLDSFTWSNALLANTAVRTFASYLLNDDVEPFGSELFAKPSGTGVLVPDHQDDYYWCVSDGNALTIWFALATSDQRSGAVYYFPGSHRIGLRSHSPSGVPGSSQRIADWSGIDREQQELVVLEPGDCVIHHARTVHGSGANESGHHRLGLTVRFKGASSSIDIERQKRYLAELNAQLEARRQE